MMKIQAILLGFLLATPFVAQANSLQCQYFDYESKEIQTERNQVLKKYENRQIEQLSESESAEFNLASLLSGKTECYFSGNLNQAYAAFRVNKSFGLGKSATVFPKTLPKLPYQKRWTGKKDGIETTEIWKITQQGKQVILDNTVIDDVTANGDITIFTPMGNRVKIERRFYSS